MTTPGRHDHIQRIDSAECGEDPRFFSLGELGFTDTPDFRNGYVVQVRHVSSWTRQMSLASGSTIVPSGQPSAKRILVNGRQLGRSSGQIVFGQKPVFLIVDRKSL